MKQAKTAGLNMGVTKTFLALAAGLVIWASGAAAQEKLGDLVTEAGFDWMIGGWAAKTDQGDKINIVWKWELDKHLVTVALKWPNYEYRGMIFYKRAEEQVIQIGADNKGGTGKGNWSVDADKAILKLENIGTDGEIYKFAIAHSKVDDKTMKAEMYAVEENGELAEEPWGTLQYKRQKKQIPKKAGDKAGKDSKTGAKQKAKSMKVAEFEVVY